MKWYTLFALTALFPVHCISQATATDPPNIVIIYADDLGYGDVHCYNPNRGKIKTPNIDRLAASGMRFTDAHSSSGVCSPSRYTLLTGRYHWRTRLQSGIVGLWGPPIISPDRMTIGSVAKRAGYRTACFGKWHLGWNWEIPAALAKQFKARPKGELTPTADQRRAWQKVFERSITGGPIDRGFDTYFGVDVPNWPPYCFIKDNRTVGIPDSFLKEELLQKNQASHQGPAIQGWTLEPTLPELGRRASDYISNQADSIDPFLIYLSLTSPHTPLAVNKPWKQKSGLNAYADLVMETDSLVGDVLAALREHDLQNQTLVLFTSDNGCAPYIGVKDLEARGHFPSGPLRGYKADVWEGGHRIPFIVRWPGVVQPSTLCNQLVHQADLIRTIADILGTPLPEDAGEDSYSLLPLLQGSSGEVRTNSVSCSIRGVPSIRLHNWKYIPSAGSGGWSAGRDTNHKAQLYNLDTDLGEKNNLVSVEPEQLAQLQGLLETVITRGRSTPGKNQPNDVRVERYPVAN